MFIAGIYSFNNGEELIGQHYTHLLEEVRGIIAGVDASKCKTKRSKEKTMPGTMLYSPRALNQAFASEFEERGWEKKRITCDYPTDFYAPNHHPREPHRGAFREIDFVKETLGLEVQFGKYAFMVYNVCAKMTIFNKMGFIDAGVEIVPVKELVDEMSTGVSYFEQFVWDLEHRGIANIDIPVLIFGIK